MDRARRKIRKRKKKTTIRATTTTDKIILNRSLTDPALQLQAVRTGGGDDKPPVTGRQDMAQPKEPADGEQERAGGIRARRDTYNACSVCGARSHNEYFCAYNYMDGCFSTRACREQCSSSSPGRHAMAAQDSLRRFVRVTNVPSSLGEPELRWLFQRLGPLQECVISRAGPEGGAGFGFVTFDNRGDAEEAVDELNGHRVGGLSLRVDWAYPRAHHA